MLGTARGTSFEMHAISYYGHYRQGKNQFSIVKTLVQNNKHHHRKVIIDTFCVNGW